MQPQIALVAELIVEVECWREVGDITHGIDINAAIILNEVRVLRLEQEPDVVIVLLNTMAKIDTGIVSIVFILGIATEVAIKVVVEMIVDGVKPWIPHTILGNNASKDIVRQIAEIVSKTIALVLTISQLIGKLQMSALPQRLAIGCAQHITTIIGRCGVVAGSEVG